MIIFQTVQFFQNNRTGESKQMNKHSGRIEVKPALKILAGMQATYKAAWVSACKHDDIDPLSSFVVFSDDNPFVPFYEKALTEYRQAITEYQAGGYIGLTLA
jgi:hypothetical protein